MEEPVYDVRVDFGSHESRDMFEVDDESEPGVLSAFCQVKSSNNLVDVFEWDEVEMFELGEKFALVCSHVDFDDGSEGLKPHTCALHDAFVFASVFEGSFVVGEDWQAEPLEMNVIVWNVGADLYKDVLVGDEVHTFDKKL